MRRTDSPELPAPDEEITDDRNNPATVRWLDVCRKLHPCDNETFEGRIPLLISLGIVMQEKIRKSKLS